MLKVKNFGLIIPPFLFLGVMVHSQPLVVREIKQVNPITKEVYIFPHVQHLSAPLIASKINNSLRAELLGSDSTTPANMIFNQVWRTPLQSPTLQDISYQLISNDKMLLSLDITATGCGAYCETFTRHFTINSKTGNLLRLDSLFTRTGLIRLAAEVNKSRETKLKEKLIGIRKELSNQRIQKDKELFKLYKEMEELYDHCLTIKFSAGELSASGFTLTGNKLIVYTDRCSAHYNMSIDEIGSFAFLTNVVNWKPFLTLYGVSLTK